MLSRAAGTSYLAILFFVEALLRYTIPLTVRLRAIKRSEKPLPKRSEAGFERAVEQSSTKLSLRFLNFLNGLLNFSQTLRSTLS